MQKTDGTVFSAKLISPNNDAFKVKETTLPYSNPPKIYGIILDETMIFDHHIQSAEEKANKSLRIIREVKGIATKVSTKKL